MKRSLAILVLCSLLLTACTNNPTPKGPDAGGILNVSAGGETNPLNPISKSDKAFFDLLYEPLFSLESDFKPQPVLAESYTISGNRVQLFLRPNQFFSDGTQVQATDVLETIRTLQTHPEFVYSPAVSGISDMMINGNLAITLTLKQPDAFFIDRLTFPIVPAKTQEGLYPAGSGPYCFESATQTERLFSINPHYTKTPPYISQLRLHILPDGETLRYAFRSGTIDVLYTQARKISDYGGVGSVATPMESMKFSYVGYSADHPLLKHMEIRQAISSAIDRQKLIDAVLMGRGTAADLPFHPKYYGFSQEFKLPETDINGAKEQVTTVLSALEEAVPPAFTLLLNKEDAASVNLGVSLTTMLERCGIKVTLEQLPFDQYINRVKLGQFDAYLGQVDFRSADDANLLVCSQAPLNYGGYSSEWIDGLFSNMTQATDDTAFSKSVSDLFGALRQQQPILSLYFEQDLLMSKERLLGEKTPQPEHPFSGVCNWYR